jgi:hypothetical protein
LKSKVFVRTGQPGLDEDTKSPLPSWKSPHEKKRAPAGVNFETDLTQRIRLPSKNPFAKEGVRFGGQYWNRTNDLFRVKEALSP